MDVVFGVVGLCVEVAGALIWIAMFAGFRVSARTLFAGVLLILFGFVIILAAAGGTVDRGLAANSAGKVSADLRAEVETAQRLSDAEAARVGKLAGAEYDNKSGAAQLTEAQARSVKTLAEAKTIDDDRRSKQIGYGGLMLENLLGGSGGSIALCLGCLPFLLAGGGFVFGVGFVARRRDGRRGGG